MSDKDEEVEERVNERERTSRRIEAFERTTLPIVQRSTWEDEKSESQGEGGGPSEDRATEREEEEIARRALTTRSEIYPPRAAQFQKGQLEST